MTRKVWVLVFSAMMFALPARAESTYACPDLSKAKQVADCETEESLRQMFRSTCGGENAPDAKNPGLCDVFTEFKRQRNNALWESADGEFMSYATCNVPPEQIKASKLVSIGLSRRGKVMKITCTYEGDTKFTLRTRGTCSIPGALPTKRGAFAKCSEDPASCKVVCE